MTTGHRGNHLQRAAGGAWRQALRGPRVVSALEVAIGATAVLVDIVPPTLVLLAMAAVSLWRRRDRLPNLGLVRPDRPVHLVVAILAWTVLWTGAQLLVFLPVLSRLTGQEQDLSSFDGLHGNIGMLAGLLALSWTLAAFGEELAYRGYLLTRTSEAVGRQPHGVVVAVAVTAVLFGVAHREQGLVGVLVVTLDGAFWGFLRVKYATLWASILAHGCNNTIGLVAFFLVGPVRGW